MRKIYEIGKSLTSFILFIGCAVLIVGLIFVFNGSHLQGVLCVLSGVGLAISSFALSLMVYLGEDVYAIRSHYEFINDISTEEEPGLDHTANGDDPSLLNLINSLEAEQEEGKDGK